MLAIKCISCQSYIPILTKNLKGERSYSYAYCVNCRIKIDGIAEGSENLQACGEDVGDSKISKEQLEWLKKKLK